MGDVLVCLIFVFMVLAPAIVASLNSAIWPEEEE
jgi:biopolymer transport protein ExbD